MTATAFLVPAAREKGAPVEWENVTDVEPLALGTLGADEVITLGPLSSPLGALMVYANARPNGEFETNRVAGKIGDIANYPLNVRGNVFVTGWENNGPAPLAEELVSSLRSLTMIFRDMGPAGLDNAADVAYAALAHMLLDDAFANSDAALLSRAIRALTRVDRESAAMVEMMALLSGRFPGYIPSV